MQSIEKSDKEFDRKLILFCFAVSNIVIINTKDQISDDLKTTLDTCIDSLSKIEMVRVEKPAIYFILNQKADPDVKNDLDAIHKIIATFTNNGLISMLQLDEKNFITLPSAFNSSIVDIAKGGRYRQFSTSQDFTERVSKIADSVIQQTRLSVSSNDSKLFSSIIGWIDFAHNIFVTINRFPNLTYFNDLAEKTQDQQLQEFLNQKIQHLLSNAVKSDIFAKGEQVTIEEAGQIILNEFSRIIIELENDLENFVQLSFVSTRIKVGLKKCQT